MPNLSRLPALKPVGLQVGSLPKQNSTQSLVESPVAAPLIIQVPSDLNLPNNNFLLLQTSGNMVPIDQPPAKKIALSDTTSEPLSASPLPVVELSDTEEPEPEETEPEIPRFKCKSCEKSFNTQEYADEHWESWHNLPCALCSERISYVDLPEHYEIWQALSEF